MEKGLSEEKVIMGLSHMTNFIRKLLHVSKAPLKKSWRAVADRNF